MYFLFFDTETDGVGDVNLRKQKLIQLAYILCDDNFNVLERYSSFVSGQTEINTEFHKNLSLDDINQKGKELVYVLNDFFKIVDKVMLTDGLMVGHNISYDLDILYNEAENCHYIPLWPRDFIKNNIFCTKEEATDIVKLPSIFRYKPPKLSELYQFLFKEELNQSHTADGDTEVLFQCFKKLVELELI